MTAAAPTLLGPNARPMVAIGHGPGVWKSRSIRGILCSFQWIDLTAQGYPDNDDNRCMPCLVLMRPASSDKGAYVIPQPNAFEYGDNKGNPTPYLMTAAFAAAQQLGFDMRDRSAIKHVIDIIIEAIPDLVLMPSAPPDSLDAIVKNHVHGIEAVAKINGKTIHSELL
jgi:hypothetical protein